MGDDVSLKKFYVLKMM